MRHLLAPVVLAACVVGACTPAVEEPTTAPPPSPTVSVSASSSPTPEPSPSPTVAESFPPAPASESPEQAAVRAAWMEYWRVYEKFTADPELSDLSETQQVTTGEAQNVILEAIGSLRDEGRAFMGGWQFRDVKVSEPEASASGAMESRVSYCVDRGEMVFRDIDSGDVEVSELPNLVETAVMVQGPDGTWRLAQRRNETSAC